MSAFRISVYDKDRVYQCPIGNPTSLTATIKHNEVSTLTMSLPLNHKRVQALMADGARLKVHFKGEHLISGPIVRDEIEANGGKNDRYTVYVEDDFRVLKEIAGFQVPGASVSPGPIDQSAAEYRTYTGNAETILKTAVTENGVTRLGVPGLTVAPNLNRGIQIPGGVPLRMHPLYDQLFPAVTDAGLGVTVKQIGTSLVLDAHEPETHPHPLSVSGRTLKQLTMTRSRPRASRVIVGGPGEGVERQFRYLNAPALEAAYGMRAETFRDARDAKDDPDTGALASVTMDARGKETLDEFGPTNGVAITLAGSGIFHYGPGGFHVGDRVPVKVIEGIVLTEPIKETTLEWTAKNFATVDPVLGEITNQPARKTANLFKALGKGLRNQERR